MISIVVANADPSGLPADVRNALLGETEFRFLEETRNVSRTLSCLRALKPNVLLLDSRLLYPHSGYRLAEIHRENQDSRILLVCDYCDDEYVGEALKQGARGCLEHNLPARDYVKAIRAIHGGEHWFGRRLLVTVLDELLEKVSGLDAFATLYRSVTERERDIVALVVQGMTNKEIGRRLKISAHTVKAHLQSIFHKLNIHRRAGLLGKKG